MSEQMDARQRLCEEAARNHVLQSSETLAELIEHEKALGIQGPDRQWRWCVEDLQRVVKLTAPQGVPAFEVHVGQ